MKPSVISEELTLSVPRETTLYSLIDNEMNDPEAVTAFFDKIRGHWNWEGEVKRDFTINHHSITLTAHYGITDTNRQELLEDTSY